MTDATARRAIRLAQGRAYRLGFERGALTSAVVMFTVAVLWFVLS
jgi:hypothetical protein